MAYGLRFFLPIDPLPQASLAERTAVGMVLIFLLLLPACAALFVITVVATYISWSYDRGAALRGLIARYAGVIGRHGRLVRKV
jgi:hypothetical protein